ncbi:uroporphyrinogen-III C-methyltransferase [Hydrogenophaga sp.]|uniref:uroporphyrinogen-III C-methyltransferase n=1 Tax=Hydrogenophaga sp. TaxID=1904254 RepID=UPI0035640A55
MSETTPPVIPATPTPSAAPTAAAAPSVAAAPRAPAEAPPTATAPAARGAGLWVGLLALLVAVIAIALAGLQWQKLALTQQELARQSQDTSKQAVEARTLASQAEALTHELQARLSVAELRLSEVSLQRSQLEELMLTLSRSRDDNLVQDIESALRLAQQQSQLTGSAQPLVSALQAADQRIARAAQPRLNPVQRAISRDLERIRSASLADIPSLVARLDELTRQVDQWPVQNQVGRGSPASKPQQKAQSSAPETRPSTASTPPVGVVAAVTEPSPAEAVAPTGPTDPVGPADGAPGGLSQGWARVTSWWDAAWAKAWADMTQSGRELVRVSRIDRPEAALLAPEQAFFLRENLKLQLLNARLGLLARQWASVRSDMAAVESAVGRYFEASSPQVAGAQTTLRQLRIDLVGNELPRPDETLAALAAAAGGR